jgi:hypothetical protein
MKNLTLKNVPDGLHRKLKSRAKRHGRSLNREVIATLEDVTRLDEPAEVQKWLERVRKRRNRMKVFLTDDQIEAAIGSGRK